MGGLERVATSLTIGLAGRVERILVCSRGGSPFEHVLVSAGIPIEHIPRPQPTPHRLLEAAWALADVFRRERPHVVHAHNPTAGAAAALARTLARLPEIAVVTTYHGVTPERLGRATRALTLSSDLVVGVGPTSTRSLRDVGLPEGRCATVYNAVDARPTRPPGDVRDEFGADGADLIVTVGRYVEEKNHRLLLESIALLAKERPRLRALIVGAGPLEADLRRRIADLGLGGVAELTGERSDAVDITAAADVFTLSSSSEGLPLALLEAMALGTPVVATAVGGVGDAVHDERTGLLVPPGDPPKLVSALRRLLDDRPLRDSLVENARTFVADRCSEDAMVERYAAIYLAAFAQRARSRSRRRRAGARPSK
jgi:glycosyltransferase involved in cell wall biosynthesis